jgi:hypothetical protein
MLQGALRLLRNSGSKDALQLLVHLAHPIGGGCEKHVQKCGHCGHVLASPGEGGELLLHRHHRRGPASLQCRFTLV